MARARLGQVHQVGLAVFRAAARSSHNAKSRRQNVKIEKKKNQEARGKPMVI